MSQGQALVATETNTENEMIQQIFICLLSDTLWHHMTQYKDYFICNLTFSPDYLLSS